MHEISNPWNWSDETRVRTPGPLLRVKSLTNQQPLLEWMGDVLSSICENQSWQHYFDIYQRLQSLTYLWEGSRHREGCGGPTQLHGVIHTFFLSMTTFTPGNRYRVSLFRSNTSDRSLPATLARRSLLMLANHFITPAEASPASWWQD